MEHPLLGRLTRTGRTRRRQRQLTRGMIESPDGAPHTLDQTIEYARTTAGRTEVILSRAGDYRINLDGDADTAEELQNALQELWTCEVLIEEALSDLGE